MKKLESYIDAAKLQLSQIQKGESESVKELEKTIEAIKTVLAQSRTEEYQASESSDE